MTASSFLGTNTTPPVQQQSLDSDPSWELWQNMASARQTLGNPKNFSSRVPESEWFSFTCTLRDPTFIELYQKWSNNEPGTGALVTFKDSSWFMSIVVPYQPHFPNQPDDVQVFWGYGLFPNKKGDYVSKPMTECSGKEIMTELLHHLDFPQSIKEGATCIPCNLPFITAQFLTRREEDRPKVVPEDSVNLALLGQFVEIPEDVVFTVEYSVRGAMIAVKEMMGCEVKIPKIYKGEHDLGTMFQVLKTLIA